MKTRRPGDDDASRLRPHRRRLSPEDDAIWRYLTRQLQPLRRCKARVSASRSEMGSDAGAAAPAGVEEKRLVHARQPRGSTPQARPPEPGLHPLPPVHRAPPPLADFERRKVRRIAAGSVEIDRRLDLHGARQSEAHQQLKSFIRDCVASGLSTVLVITGKGGRRESQGAAHFDSLDARDHGVLRRSVPMWLAEPDLRSLVVSFMLAHARHGGEGAFYVQLRRRPARFPAR